MDWNTGVGVGVEGSTGEAQEKHRRSTGVELKTGVEVLERAGNALEWKLKTAVVEVEDWSSTAGVLE